ncbi:excitatory amino acid transporter 3-like isoform X3 [Clinocottus analis]|uniref:excitatory amino acid transporter 3-like isoform X3 n=1 Tax=Clinocottus analis TaxID=304258 RepID=UPI0035C0A14D
METVKKYRDFIVRIANLNTSLGAVFLGVLLGLFIKFCVPLTRYSLAYMNFPALWLLRMLHAVTTPLVCTSVIVGVCGRKVGVSGKIAGSASAYWVATTFLSVTLGLMLVLVIKPGVDAVENTHREKFSLACAVLDVLHFLPFGVVLMVACLVVEAKDWELILKLGKFTGVVALGLVIHATVVLPLIYVVFARHNPYAIIKGLFPALKTAFISSSSSATLPLTLKCCEEGLNINKKICRLLLPIWTKNNINGSVIYEVVAAIFIAQLNNLRLDFSQLIVIVMVSAVPCQGGTGTRARGAVTTFLNLTVAGLPGREVSLLVVTQYLLDRCNTILNILGDCIGVALLDQVSKRSQGDIEGQREEM